jgi:release factor glutamine methyltransferase
MRTLLKHIVARTYKPLLVKYLSSTRSYRYKDIQMDIPPQVFHPGFFFSTRLLLQYVHGLRIQDKNFLELGCGSGLISIVAAKKGAKVTATDINAIAVESLKKNSRKNDADIKIILSDLFDNIAKQAFDIIAINPPYYRKQPITAHDYAWFCGENGEYFSKLFEGLSGYINGNTEIIMVLFEDCEMEMIAAFATRHGFRLNCVHSKKNILEENFIYRIEKI